MNNYTINTTQTFEEEFQNILFYIHSILKEPNISIKLYNKIINKILSLDISPERNPKIHYLNSDTINIRKLIIDRFVVIYEVNTLKRRNISFTYFPL